MSSYILIHNDVKDKKWWNHLITACAVIGEPFEIHCWTDEKTQTKLALEYGKRMTSTWRDGTVIRGIITKEFISFLTQMDKPMDTEVYNKMTPFFTIILGSQLQSEHYGTEIILSRTVRERYPYIGRILSELESCAVVHRNVRG